MLTQTPLTIHPALDVTSRTYSAVRSSIDRIRDRLREGRVITSSETSSQGCLSERRFHHQVSLLRSFESQLLG